MDETPYGGHVDQLTLIFHYMEKDMPVERFLKLLLNQAHKAQDMFKGLLHFSHENKIDIASIGSCGKKNNKVTLIFP